MVKQAFIILTLLFGAARAKAQILVGPVAGGGVSWVSFHEPESRKFYKQTPVPTFNAGLGLSFQVRKNFYMHSALLYSRKGENLSSDVDPLLKHKEIYHFIDVPIVFAREFKIKVGKNKVVKWYAGIGPNIGYWLSGKGSLINNQLMEDNLPAIDYKFSFKSTDNPDPSKVYLADANRWQLGLNFAMGWVFEPVGFDKIYFNVRYEVGHSYISKSAVETFPGINDYSGDTKARNMGLHVSLSYLIDLKPAERKKGKSVSKKRR